MNDRTLQYVFDPLPAGDHLVTGGLLCLHGKIAMGDGVRADGDQRIGRERLQLVPGHAEIAADRDFVDAVTGTQRADFTLDIELARQSAQPVVQPVERGPLGGRRAGIEADARAADFDLDRRRLGDHHLQRDPPQPAGAFGEIAGDVDGGGCVEFTQDRQREIAIVAIAVVEREAGEASRKVAFDQTLMHLVHGDNIDSLRPKMRQHGAQEPGRDLQMPVGLEFAVMTGANMVQHENGPHAREDRPQQMMGAGEVKCFQSGANDVVAKLLHQEWSALECNRESYQLSAEETVSRTTMR